MSVPYYGDFPEDATVYIPINTFSSDDPSASVTVTNLLNTDVHIHKDGNTTQRNNAAGITMSIDYDSITGNHLLTIDTSDDTVAGFWVTGSEYQIRIEGATVDGGTINAWVGAFSIERSGGALALLKNGTYGLSALNTDIDAILADTNELQGDWTDGGRLDLIIDAILDDTDLIDDGTSGLAKIATDVAAILVDTNELQTDDIPGTLSTIAGYLDTEIAAILADTNELQGDWTNGGRLDLILDELTTQGDTNEGKLDTIITDTNELQTDWTNGGRLDLIIDAILADTNELQTDDVPGLIGALNDIAASDVWDLASALTLDFGTLLERVYQLLNNEMNITNADGSVALRNLADSADIATGSITDNGTTTSRAAYSWV